jgi:hypothetical protein
MSNLYYNNNIEKLNLKKCCSNKVIGIRGPTGKNGNGPIGPIGFRGLNGESIKGPTGIGCTGPTGPNINFTGELIGTTGPYESYLQTREFYEVTDYFKIIIDEKPYWVPLISEDPIQSFPSPLYDSSNILYEFYDLSSSSVNIKWFPVSGAVQYKIFYIEQFNFSQGYYHNLLFNNNTDIVNTYDKSVFNEINVGNVLNYTFTLNPDLKYNIFIYAYDALGNRSETPTTQLYLNYDSSNNIIDYAIWPVYLYIIGGDAKNWDEFKNLNLSGYVIILNNYYKSYFGPISNFSIIESIPSFPQVNPYDTSLCQILLT